MRPPLSVLTRSPLVLLVLALAIFPGPARAETTLCTAITTVPFTIAAPGIYCLDQDFSTNLASGAAITIATNNVVLDLNGHVLGNLAAGPGTQATGILAVQRKNLTIRNGTVRGFEIGIDLADTSPFTTSQGHVIEDLRVDQNTDHGMRVSGRGNIIRNNQVVATGGSTASSNVSAFGILVFGPESRVLNNDVIDTFGTGTGSGVAIEFNTAFVALAVNNQITQADVGIFYISSSGKFRDNLTSGVTSAFFIVPMESAVVDAGGNN